MISKANIKSIIILVAAMIIMFGSKTEIYAEVIPTDVPETISLKTLGGNEEGYSSDEIYLYPAISDLKTGQTVTYTSSDANVFVIGYEDDSKFGDVLTETYKKPAHELNNNVWSTNKVCLLAKNEGQATLTVTVSGNSLPEVTSKYTIKIARAVPKLSKVTHKNIRAGLYDDYAEVTVKNIYPDYTVAISCNKKNVLKVGKEYFKINKYVTNNYTYTAKKLGIENSADDVSLYFCAMKKGTIDLTVTVLNPNGDVLTTRDYTLKATTYENPFSSLKIGSKDYKKYFKHYLTIGNGIDVISTEQARYTLGKQMSFKLKKGYTLEKITYLNKDEWRGAVKRHKLNVQKSGNTYKTVFPSKCWDMEIVYKDKNKKKHYATFYYSVGTVPE